MNEDGNELAFHPNMQRNQDLPNLSRNVDAIVLAVEKGLGMA